MDGTDSQLGSNLAAAIHFLSRQGQIPSAVNILKLQDKSTKFLTDPAAFPILRTAEHAAKADPLGDDNVFGRHPFVVSETMLLEQVLQVVFVSHFVNPPPNSFMKTRKCSVMG